MTRRPIDVALSRMRKMGLSQAELARRMNVPPQHITNWKARGMPAEQWVAAADALELSLDELLGRAALSHPAWPFSIDRAQFNGLTRDQLSKVEGAMTYVLGQIRESDGDDRKSA